MRKAHRPTQPHADPEMSAFKRYLVPEMISFGWILALIGSIGLSVTSIALAYFNPTAVKWFHAYFVTFGLFIFVIALRVSLELVAVAFDILLELRTLRRLAEINAEPEPYDETEFVAEVE